MKKIKYFCIVIAFFGSIESFILGTFQLIIGMIVLIDVSLKK